MLELILFTLSGGAALNFIISLVIAGLIFWLVIWFLRWVGVPEPFNKIIKVVLGLAVLIYLINALLTVSGQGGFIK